MKFSIINYIEVQMIHTSNQECPGVGLRQDKCCIPFHELCDTRPLFPRSIFARTHIAWTGLAVSLWQALVHPIAIET